MSQFRGPQSDLLAERYLLGDEIGRGGMAVVRQAWDCVLNRDVAVKMLHDMVIDPGARVRFEIEGETLAGLSHPGLIPLFDAGTDQDRPFLVMELVPGETLAERCRQYWLSPDEVGAFGVGLADALSYVHRCGIVHRDVKPSNVLIGRDERVRLADFGIARMLDSAVRHTATGLTIGTAAYLSPEQVRGESATAASDVYSLGLVLLEALTGRPAFTGAPHVVALARLTHPPAVDNSLPPALRSLLTAMTADRPVDRPTAAEVGTRLRTMNQMPGPDPQVGTQGGARVPTGPRLAPPRDDGDGPTEDVTATGTTAPTIGRPHRHRGRDRLVAAGSVLVATAVTWLLGSPLGGTFRADHPHTGATAPGARPTSAAPASIPSTSSASTRSPVEQLPTRTAAAVPTSLVKAATTTPQAAAGPTTTTTTTTAGNAKSKAAATAKSNGNGKAKKPKKPKKAKSKG